MADPKTDRQHLEALLGGLDLWHQFGAELPVDKAYKAAKHYIESQPKDSPNGREAVGPNEVIYKAAKKYALLLAKKATTNPYFADKYEELTEALAATCRSRGC